MDHEKQSDVLKSLVRTLEELTASRLSVIEASRQISAARFALRQEQNPLFLPFVGIDSETDAFPIGAVRDLWASDALELYDRKREVAEQLYLPRALEAAAPLLEWSRSNVP